MYPELGYCTLIFHVLPVPVMSESVFCILLALQDKDVNGDYLLLSNRT